MYKYLYSLIFLLVQTFCINAQSNEVNSLKQKLLHEPPDTNRVILLNQLCFLYLTSDPETSLSLAQEAFFLSQKLNYSKGEATSLKRLATVFDITGNYPKALELSLAALKKFEAIGNSQGIQSVLANISIIFGEQEDYKEALKYSYKSKELAENLHDTLATMRVFSNMGSLYELSDNLDSARVFTGLAYNLALRLQNSEFTGMTLAENGNINRKMKQFQISLGYYRTAISYLHVTENFYSLCDVYLGMAKSFRMMGQNDSALYYAKLSFSLAKQNDFTSEVLVSSLYLSGYYNDLKNVDSAFKYQNFIITAKDSLFSQEKNRRLQSLTLDEILRQQQIAANKAAIDSERKINIQYGIISLSLISFTILYFILTQSIIINEKWIGFLGVLGLLLIFEFINLLIHPLLAAITHHSPVLMLIISVFIASMLIPLHHNIEHWVKNKLVEKNKRLRIAAAKKIIARAETETKES